MRAREKLDSWLVLLFFSFLFFSFLFFSFLFCDYIKKGRIDARRDQCRVGMYSIASKLPAGTAEGARHDC